MLLEIDPEATHLFALARHVGDVTTHRITRLPEWQRLVQLALDENAVIALRDSLGAVADADLMPTGLERHVAMLALDRAYRMRVLQTRFEGSLAALSSAGIRVLLLKGAALACTTYGSFVARPMRDIDLLVRPEDASAARAVLLDVGWESDPDIPDDSVYGEHQHLSPLRDASVKGICLEIHRSLLAKGHPFRFTEEEIWEAARPVNVGSARACVMHPHHHSVYLPIHFAWSHRLKSGAWHTFRDLDALVGSGDLDWDAMVNTAREWGALSCCYWTLELGRHLSGLPVPEAVLSQLRPRIPEVMRRGLTRHFLNSILQNGRTCPSVRLDHLLWSVAMQPERDGHGAVRPWLLGREVTSAFVERARRGAHSRSDSALLRMHRATRYVTELLA